MFSENGRISKRQIRRLLIYDLFGINTLLLPVLLAKYVGKDGIFSIFGAWVLLLCYLVFLEKLHRRMPCGYMEYLKRSCGTFLSLGVCFFVFCILHTARRLCTVYRNFTDPKVPAKRGIVLADRVFPVPGRSVRDLSGNGRKSQGI